MDGTKTKNNYLEILTKSLFDIQDHYFSNPDMDNTLVFTGFNSEEITYIREVSEFTSSQQELFVLSTSKEPLDHHISVAEFDKILEARSKTGIFIAANDKIKLQNFEGFEEIKRSDIEEKIVEDLVAKIPEAYRRIVDEDILQCLEYVMTKEINKRIMVEYLMELEKSGYTPEVIGNSIYLLNLLPDTELLSDDEQIRIRVDANLRSINLISQFDLPVYNRITQLSLKPGSIQRDLVDFFNEEKAIKDKSTLARRIFEHYEKLNFTNWDIDLDNLAPIALPTEHVTPKYDLMVGNSSPTPQFGIIGESQSGRKVAIDLSGTNTISLFGVQGGGKSYTIGTISEMVLKQFSHVSELPNPLAGVIFHFSESMDYEPEFTSMMYANSKDREIAKLKERYGADPDCLDDVIIICPKDKVKEKQLEYPSIQIEPIAFNPGELNVADWMFMLGAMGNDANYVRQLKAIAKNHRKGISIDAIEKDVRASILFTEFEKGLALQKLDFAREYVDEKYSLKTLLLPGRLIIVDLRDEFIDKDEALGLFVVILNIFSAVKEANGKRFNKFIVFDEAHKYMDNVALTGTIVTAIREMRHKGVNIMIASQDPPSLPKEIIELSSVVLLHKFNSPQWLDHIKNALTQLEILAPQDMSTLSPGEGYLWATKATERGITYKPLKISARPRVTQHGGATLQAGESK